MVSSRGGHCPTKRSPGQRWDCHTPLRYVRNDTEYSFFLSEQRITSCEDTRNHPVFHDAGLANRLADLFSPHIAVYFFKIQVGVFPRSRTYHRSLDSVPDRSSRVSFQHRSLVCPSPWQEIQIPRWCDTVVFSLGAKHFRGSQFPPWWNLDVREDPCRANAQFWWWHLIGSAS